MGDIIKRKLNIGILAVMSAFLLTAALLCAGKIKEALTAPDIKAATSEVNLLVSQIEDTHGYVFFPPYNYAVILLDKTVAYSKGSKLNRTVNPHSFSGAASDYLIVPFEMDGEIAGMVYVELVPYFCEDNPKEAYLWGGVFATVFAFTVFAGLSLQSIIKKDIFEPIGELHSSTCDILYGKLDKPVRYDYDGEIGTLCHDFELMRTELSDGRRREKELKDNEKILMASISHDLKTPLATVQGYLESICLGVVSDKRDIRRYCENALNKILLLDSMTKDILEHSKAELHQLSIDKKEVYSEEFFKELSILLSFDAKSRGLSLTVGEIPNVIISLDQTRIAQVLENLVGNSIKYGEKGGRIKLSFSQDGEFFFVAVKDNGQGISPEDLPFIFDRFFRGDKSRTQNVPGSGLGLSIVKYIVEQHGGTIECDSVPGVGTEMRFSLKL